MEQARIRDLVKQLDTTKTLAQDQVWDQLRPLGETVVPYLVEFYEEARKWQGRVAAVFHCTRYARSNEAAFRLGLKACDDRATLVRYRACGLLAYSLRKDALPTLEALRDHPDPETREDAAAAIEAITQKNHHLFIDRDGSGRTFWIVNPEDDPALTGSLREGGGG